MKYLMSILLISVLFSCYKTDELCNEENYNSYFKIKDNEQYCFPDGNYFEVKSLINGFCPCNMDCFWEGEMIMHFTANFDSIEKDTLIGSCDYHDRTFVVEPYEIHFDNIIFEVPCDEQNPSPKIIEASVIVKK